MTSDFSSSGPPEPAPNERAELERDVRDWLETQPYSPSEIDRVMAKVKNFDARTLHESFFASLGTGSLEFSELIQSMLEPEGDSAAAELDQVVAHWPSLSPNLRKALCKLANGSLPPATQRAIVAMIESISPT